MHLLVMVMVRGWDEVATVIAIQPLRKPQFLKFPTEIEPNNL